MGVWLLDGATTSWGDRIGTLLILASVVCAAIYSVLAARVLRHDSSPADPITTTAWQFTIALMAIVPVAGGISLYHPSLGEPLALHWAAAIGSGVVGLALPFAAYNYAIAVIPVGEAALLLQATPLAGVAVSVVVLGEQMAPTQMVGACVVVVGVALAGGAFTSERGRRLYPQASRSLMFVSFSRPDVRAYPSLTTALAQAPQDC
ncbi:DMT family transporter [Streptosporangium lutulentum]